MGVGLRELVTPASPTSSGSSLPSTPNSIFTTFAGKAKARKQKQKLTLDTNLSELNFPTNESTRMASYSPGSSMMETAVEYGYSSSFFFGSPALILMTPDAHSQLEEPGNQSAFFLRVSYHDRCSLPVKARRFASVIYSSSSRFRVAGQHPQSAAVEIQPHQVLPPSVASFAAFAARPPSSPPPSPYAQRWHGPPESFSNYAHHQAPPQAPVPTWVIFSAPSASKPIPIPAQADYRRQSGGMATARRATGSSRASFSRPQACRERTRRSRFASIPAGHFESSSLLGAAHFALPPHHHRQFGVYRVEEQ
ncbi:hypothetical protein BD779DRAFT_1677397 [Infundibulicybe gibba]|nr:hypothetical protein BD779DRAFT_1677397 [Infundibulicybe gibba]